MSGRIAQGKGKARYAGKRRIRTRKNEGYVRKMPKKRLKKIRVHRPAFERRKAKEEPISLPDIPPDHKHLKWSIFHPSIVKVSLALLLFALLSLGVLSRLFSSLDLIPCLIEGGGWGMCPVNPSQLSISTIYFGMLALDIVYPWVYALLLFIALPYLLSCLLVHYYNVLFN